MESPSAPLLQVRDLTVRFGSFTAVRNASFELHAGETLAIVGESGSGKSVTALSIMRLVDLGTRGEIVGGEVVLTMPDGSQVDLVQASEKHMRQIRGNHVSMIFQEPLTSLNPVYTVGNQVAEAVKLHQGLGRSAARQRALEMFERVRIPDAERRLKEYPHQMSGGMRQRVMIAMALSCDPTILIADEPTTALDVTIQAQILSLMRQLQDDTGAAVIIITHDMGVVAEVADRVIVMNRSEMVEHGDVYEIFERPTEDYTKSLLAAVPQLGSMAGTDEPERFHLRDEASR
jgi:ABC-type dipeptide/oligopeptide/nickel transport system ATPase component